MFEEPVAKRIRRSEVFDEGSSDGDSDEEVTATTTIQEIKDSIGLAYHFDYDLIENADGQVTTFAHLQVDAAAAADVDPAPVVDDEEAFEFRLFATPNPPKDGQSLTRPNTAPTRINIRSPTPTQPSDGRFVVPHRPQAYYFAPAAASATLATCAISGAAILASAHGAWPGTHLPWRVMQFPMDEAQARRQRRSTTDDHVMIADGAKGKGKGKPNKKRRILLRTRARAQSERAREKEEHVREKKTRLNREKKIKRKAKDKALKAVKKSVEGEGGGGGWTGGGAGEVISVLRRE